MGIFSDSKKYTINYTASGEDLDIVADLINPDTIKPFLNRYRVILHDIDIVTYPSYDAIPQQYRRNNTHKNAVTYANIMNIIAPSRWHDKFDGDYKAYCIYQITKCILENINPKCNDNLKKCICYYESDYRVKGDTIKGQTIETHKQIIKYIIDHYTYRELVDIIRRNDMKRYADYALERDLEFLNSESTILETANVDKRFKCPYCDTKLTREKLVDHINDIHEDLIPEGYTASRVVFNTIYKKDVGTCVICKKPTTWDEANGRYKRYCSEECRKKYAEIVQGRVLKKYGTTTLATDPEHQKKMLANRKISGTYKFKDGGVRSYVGTYERKALEFLDKVMNYRSEDILTPGPTIEYEYDNEVHYWITDIYIIPNNLVIDVKDGGKNPNTRTMEDYRAKQLKKELAIKNLGTYNYLRLTDNDFKQLMTTLVDIKNGLRDDGELPIININESYLKEFTPVAGINPVVGMNQNYIIPTMIDNCFTGNYVTDKKNLGKLYKYNYDTDDVDEFNPDELDECTYEIYKVTTDKDIKELAKLAEFMSLAELSREFNIEPVIDIYTESMIKMSINEATIINTIKDTLEIKTQNTINEYTDMNGTFYKNKNYRTKSYNEVPYLVEQVLNKM